MHFPFHFGWFSFVHLWLTLCTGHTCSTPSFSKWGHSSHFQLFKGHFKHPSGSLYEQMSQFLYKIQLEWKTHSLQVEKLSPRVWCACRLLTIFWPQCWSIIPRDYPHWNNNTHPTGGIWAFVLQFISANVFGC